MTSGPRLNRAVVGAIATITIAGCGLSLTIALLSVRLDAMGFSARAIGFSTAVAGVASLACAPVIPWVARRIGVARTLLASLVFGGLALFAFTATDSYAAWLALRFIVSASVTVLFVLSEYWISTAATGDTRGLAIGLYATSLGVGFAVGPLLLAALGAQGDLPFQAGAALFWLAVIPLLVNSRGAPALAERSGKRPWHFLAEAPVAMAAGLLQGAIEVAGISLLPVYALRAGGSVEQGALFASLFVLGNSALQVPLGLLSDRMDRQRLLLAIAALGFAGAVLLALMGIAQPIVFEVMLLLWGGTVGGLYPVGLAQLGAVYRGADLAGATAAFVMTYSLGMMAGPPLVGAGLDLIPPDGFFLTVAAMIAVYLAASTVILRRTALRARLGKVRGVS